MTTHHLHPGTQRNGTVCILALVALFAASAVNAESPDGGYDRPTASSGGYYDDWWLCVDQCGEEDADCVDGCTDEFNKTHSSPYPKGLCLDPWFAVAQLRQRRHAGPTDLVARCPEGTFLSPFEMPIYDDAGLFVVGYETVWFCLPDDLEPAG